MKTIRVVSGQFDVPQSLTTAATTWGELQEDLDAAGISYLDKRVMIKSTKTDLVDNDAVLPEGDLIIFMHSKKVEAGTEAPNFTKMSFTELKRLARDLDISTPKPRDEQEIKARLSAYYVGASGVNSEAESSNAYDGIMDMLKDIKGEVASINGSVGATEPVASESPAISEEDQALMDELRGM